MAKNTYEELEELGATEDLFDRSLCPFNNDICYHSECQLWKKGDCSINWLVGAINYIAEHLTPAK